MSNVSPSCIKDSPKTRSGISKSLLTPCRRVGLSRKWRKSGCSPFISPLSGQTTTPERAELAEAPMDKKRKISDESEKLEKNNETGKEQTDVLHEVTSNSPLSCNSTVKNIEITTTPCRNIQIPRKKSKTLSLSIKNSCDSETNDLPCKNDIQHHKQPSLVKNESHEKEIGKNDKYSTSISCNKEKCSQNVVEMKLAKHSSSENLSKPVRTESRSKKLSLKKSLSKSNCNSEPKPDLKNIKPKQNSPNNLTKECIVVIQKKIFKSDHNDKEATDKMKEQSLEESDSEIDVPLSAVKQNSIENTTLNTLNDNDFISEPIKKPVRNLSIKRNKANKSPAESCNSSQSSQETDKKTIIVMKTYDKVTKPLKAKSTGSITQKDIDDIKVRIEMKKKLLLAKTMSVDTEELRGLIKKWQKGCQDALMELLDLMKKKLPDRQNMDYSEILSSLKIPPELVGYDSENDCFITPDDNNIILSTFKL